MAGGERLAGRLQAPLGICSAQADAPDQHIRGATVRAATLAPALEINAEHAGRRAGAAGDGYVHAGE
jgi:hypothetical protein